MSTHNERPQVDGIDCPDRCPPHGIGHEHFTHETFGDCPGRCDQPGAHPSAAHLPHLFDLPTFGGHARIVCPGDGQITFAAAVVLRPPWFTVVFPPSLGEYR